MPMNIPWTSVVVFSVCIAAIVTLIATGHSNDATVTILLGLLPSMVAAGYAERTNRDVRNGIMEDKVKAGTKTALAETGVTEVVSNANANTQVWMTALSTQTAALTKLINDKTEKAGDPNGGKVL